MSRPKKPRRPIFQLVRPCEHCPFRKDRPGFLTAARAKSIAEEIADPVGAYFMCHQTLQYTDRGTKTKNFAVCAGSLICMAKGDGFNKSARIGAALGLFDTDRLDLSAPVLEGLGAFAEHHSKSDRR